MNRVLQTQMQALDQTDPKEYVLRLVARGELMMSRPLSEQMRVALERLGFGGVRVDHERVHDIWLVRATMRLTSPPSRANREIAE